MMSMLLSNVPFYVLERQKCVNLRKKLPIQAVVGFSGFRWEDLTRKNSGGVETPVGAIYLPNKQENKLLGKQI